MKDREKLVRELARLSTEQTNPDTTDIDRLSAQDIAHKINREDSKVAAIVKQAIPRISEAAEIFAATLKKGGRVFYVGAGTSGRLGVLDAAECPPTFGTDPKQIVGLISGGHETLVLSLEGAEDRIDEPVIELRARGLSQADFVIGLAASVRTPYTRAALEYAIEVGAGTAFIICNEPVNLPAGLDIVISLPVGPEVITGSTRMKSGTAQKMTLNMISTTAMVLLGKTFGNLMVDLQCRSEKLAARSRKILMDLLELDYEQADQLLISADGVVKTAIVMHKLSCSREEALRRLDDGDGFVSRVI
ncbi:MAG: N-acetylmuramic acid 6-phosphate etherase [candidate division Zixibacteria bacterium]|nr:N-acetylmuramic acid 6-phosphate etherase [candidate division Zixibacteria bacterium]